MRRVPGGTHPGNPCPSHLGRPGNAPRQHPPEEQGAGADLRASRRQEEAIGRKARPRNRTESGPPAPAMLLFRTSLGWAARMLPAHLRVLPHAPPFHLAPSVAVAGPVSCAVRITIAVRGVTVAGYGGGVWHHHVLVLHGRPSRRPATDGPHTGLFPTFPDIGRADRNVVRPNPNPFPPSVEQASRLQTAFLGSGSDVIRRVLRHSAKLDRDIAVAGTEVEVVDAPAIGGTIGDD